MIPCAVHKKREQPLVGGRTAPWASRLVSSPRNRQKRPPHHQKAPTPTPRKCFSATSCSKTHRYVTICASLRDSPSKKKNTRTHTPTHIHIHIHIPGGFLLPMDVARGRLRHGPADLGQGVGLERGRGGVHPVVQVVVCEEHLPRRVVLRRLLLLFNFQVIVIKLGVVETTSIPRGRGWERGRRGFLLNAQVRRERWQTFDITRDTFEKYDMNKTSDTTPTCVVSLKSDTQLPRN